MFSDILLKQPHKNNFNFSLSHLINPMTGLPEFPKFIATFDKLIEIFKLDLLLIATYFLENI